MFLLRYTGTSKNLFCCTYMTLADEIHNANDDCAICKAWSKKHAIKKFKKMYCNFEESNVFCVKYNKYGIAVLTDY